MRSGAYCSTWVSGRRLRPRRRKRSVWPRTHSAPVNNLMLADMALNRLQEARNAFDEARARKLDGVHLRHQRYRLAFLLGDRAQMEEQVAWAMGKPKVENWLLWAESDSATYYGRVRNAREFSRRAVQSALKDDAPETAAGWQAFQAWAEAEIGNSGRAQEMAAESLALSAGREVGSTAALALARAGDTAQAQKMAEKLNQEFPLDTLMQNSSLPAIRAAIELAKNNPDKAIEILRIATPYELGTPIGGKLCPSLSARRSVSESRTSEGGSGGVPEDH